MKKRIILSIPLALFAIMAASQTWSIGVAGIYGDEIENAGVHIRGYYNFKGNKVCFGPEFSQFFKTTETIGGESIEKNLSEINFNVHYVIELSEGWGFYPLSGMNVSFEKEKNLTSQEQHSISELGLNLGAGIHREFGPWIFFVEYDHLFSKVSQNSMLLGAFFTFGKSHKE